MTTHSITPLTGRQSSLAVNVQSLVRPGVGHWVAEQVPEVLVAALTEFLAPYRDDSAAVHTPRPEAAITF